MLTFSRVDGLYVRQNKGYDFAAWAHVLQLRAEILDAKVLYFINDSLIGPIDLTKFSDVIRKIRASKADVIGLSENLAGAGIFRVFFWPSNNALCARAPLSTLSRGSSATKTSET